MSTGAYRRLPRHRGLALLATVVLAVASGLVGIAVRPTPAAASVIAPMNLIYQTNTYGDFIHIGNAVLGCPPNDSSPR